MYYLIQYIFLTFLVTLRSNYLCNSVEMEKFKLMNFNFSKSETLRF